MAIPGEGIEKNWRNNINEVARLLNGKHGPNYRIFNLTGEEYDYQKFNNQVVDHFDFPDHHPPCMKKYLAVIKAIDEWMVSNPEHVAVVHCLAGRSRTGCVVAGYFLYSSLNGTATSPPLMTTAKEAITFFNMARSEEGQNIVLPSQVRWVNYLEKVLKEKRTDIIANPPKYLLKSIRIYPPPLVEVGKKKAILTPITYVKHLAESAKDSRPPITEAVHPQLWHDDPPTDLKVDIEVTGDIEIIFYHNSKNTAKYAATMNNLYSKFQAIQLASHFPRVPLFRYIFNTAFLTGDKLVVTPEELDAPLAGPVVTNQYVPKNMTVEFTFEKIPDTSTTPVSVLDSSRISSKVDLVPTSVFKTQSNPNIAAATATNYSAPASTMDPIMAAVQAVANTSTVTNPSHVATIISTNSLPQSANSSPALAAPSRPKMPAPTTPPIMKQLTAPTILTTSHSEPSPSPRRAQLSGDPMAPGMALLANVTGGGAGSAKTPTPSPNRSPRVSVSTNDNITGGTSSVNPSTNAFATNPSHQRSMSELNVPSVSTRRTSDPLRVPNTTTERRPSDPSKPLDSSNRPFDLHRNHLMTAPPGQLPQLQIHSTPLPSTSPQSIPPGHPLQLTPTSMPQVHSAPPSGLAPPPADVPVTAPHPFPTIPNHDPAHQVSPSSYPDYPPYPGLQPPPPDSPVLHPMSPRPEAYPYPDPNYYPPGTYNPHQPYPSYPYDPYYPPSGYM